MLIQVQIGYSERGYTFESDIPLSIGDRVRVPVRNTEAEATVVALSSDYRGPVKSVISKVDDSSSQGSANPSNNPFIG